MTTTSPDPVILGLLAADVRYGYQLLQYFREPAALGRIWTLSTSQLYAVLKRLSRDGMITGESVASTDAPARTEYRLTDAGYVALADWLEERNPSASVRAVRVDFLSKLYISRLLNLPTIDLIRNQKRACQTRRDTLSDEIKTAAPGIEYLTLQLVIAQLDTVLAWIDGSELAPRTPPD